MKPHAQKAFNFILREKIPLIKLDFSCKNNSNKTPNIGIKLMKILSFVVRYENLTESKSKLSLFRSVRKIAVDAKNKTVNGSLSVVIRLSGNKQPEN